MSDLKIIAGLDISNSTKQIEKDLSKIKQKIDGNLKLTVGADLNNLNNIQKSINDLIRNNPKINFETNLEVCLKLGMHILKGKQ